jgi:hypothetical protein
MENKENIKEELIIICPHCNVPVIIEKINCAIFRHGIFKKNGKQINPHSTKELCDYYIRENKIYGCGKPFRIIAKDNSFVSEICDYI